MKPVRRKWRRRSSVWSPAGATSATAASPSYGGMDDGRSAQGGALARWVERRILRRVRQGSPELSTLRRLPHLASSAARHVRRVWIVELALAAVQRPGTHLHVDRDPPSHASGVCRRYSLRRGSG